MPESRRNEVLRFIAAGLQDFSISRSRARARGWGIPVPGDPEQVMYVWLDALANYITALDYATDGDAVPALLGATRAERVHVDRQGHPALPRRLLAGDAAARPGCRCRRTVFVHGYFTVGGRKIGK